MKTEFLTPIDLLDIIARVKNGEEEAIDLIIKDYDRLQNRIKDLEMHISSMFEAYNSNRNTKPVR